MTVDAVGGVWRHAIDTARGLNERGIAVVLAGLGPLPSPDRMAEAGALPMTDIVWLELPLDWMASEETALDPLPAILARLTDEFCFDLVHLNVPSQAAGLKLSCPVVTTAHSCVATWWDAVRSGPLPPELEWQKRRTLEGFNTANAVIAPSRSHADALERCYGKVANLTVVPNAAMPGPRCGARKPLVFAAGRWWDEGKNGACLAAAAPHISWPMVMAGPLRGPNGASIALPGVEAPGELPASAVRHAMAEAEIVASPSLYEPFGLGVLEAALSGAALVLADIPTFRELWHGAAVFANPRDPSAFAGAIQRLIDQPKARHRLGQRAHRRAQRFNMEAEIEALTTVYARAMAAQGAPRAAAE
jgi:glycosyltransferase involved in cell wall biosynthesis